jgi:GntR family transcriptional repressor for pyruvate dehydrogenase complex
LSTLLDGVSSQTLRARVWRGLVDDNAAGRTLAEHEAIYTALAAGDSGPGSRGALVHVATTDNWLRAHLEAEAENPEGN